MIKGGKWLILTCLLSVDCRSYGAKGESIGNMLERHPIALLVILALLVLVLQRRIWISLWLTFRRALSLKMSIVLSSLRISLIILLFGLIKFFIPFFFGGGGSVSPGLVAVFLIAGLVFLGSLGIYVFHIVKSRDEPG